MLELRKYKKVSDLPERYQLYNLVLMNKGKYLINGIQKANIMVSPKNFVELDRGVIINKAAIAEIYLNIEETKAQWTKLCGD